MIWLDALHHEQQMFDFSNDSMPERYKVTLENRSWAPGAAREWIALVEYARDRKRSKGKTT